MVSLGDLPTEIILQVIESLRSARDISHLSLVNSRFHKIVEQDGYRTFLQHAFPHTYVPLPIEYAGGHSQFFKDAAHSVSTLSKNWDQKALIATQILPLSVSPSHRYGFRSRQTMGFTPVLDSREEWYGGDWRDRNQILVCGAGAQLYLQVINLAKEVFPSTDRSPSLHQPKFGIYDERGCLDGRDDISTLKILPQSQRHSLDIIVGRCNGDLAWIRFDRRRRSFRRHFTLRQKGVSVKSVVLNDYGMLIVALSDRTLEMYQLQPDGEAINSLDQLYLPQPQQQTRTHALENIDGGCFGVGSAFTPFPLEIFDTSGRSIRQFSYSSDAAGRSDASYSISAVPEIGGRPGQALLCGGYDGRIRLYDMRAKMGTVIAYEDRIDYSPVYSLAIYGQERFVAGGTSGLLKVFNLRMNRSRSDRGSGHDHTIVKLPTYESKSHSSDWNVFLSSQKCVADSPIYSLSKPSSVNPTIFAGLEGAVFQLDITSTTDQSPDPVYGELPRSSHMGHNIRTKWGFKRRVLQLSMYEHPKSFSESVKLRKQRPLGAFGWNSGGWDKRWSD